MVEPLTCRYCGVAWDAEHRQFAHEESCYIETGIFPPTLGRKKRPATPEPVKPLLDLDEDFQ